MAKTWVTNTITGLVSLVPERWLHHPVIGATLKRSRSGKPVMRFAEPAVSVEEIEALRLTESESTETEKDD